jgi:hypothetical protein
MFLQDTRSAQLDAHLHALNYANPPAWTKHAHFFLGAPAFPNWVFSPLSTHISPQI